MTSDNILIYYRRNMEMGWGGVLLQVNVNLKKNTFNYFLQFSIDKVTLKILNPAKLIKND